MIRQWELLLPEVPLGPNSRHLFKIEPTNKTYSHVKLSMIPDGGFVSPEHSHLQTTQIERVAEEHRKSTGPFPSLRLASGPFDL